MVSLFSLCHPNHFVRPSAGKGTDPYNIELSAGNQAFSCQPLCQLSKMRRFLEVLLWAHILLLLHPSAASVGTPRGKLFEKHANGSLIPIDNNIPYEDIFGENQVASWPVGPSSFGSLQNCSSDANCDYAACSERGHEWGCGIAGWNACYFVAPSNHTDFCITLCTGDLSYMQLHSQMHGYPASFCPVLASSGQVN